MAAAAARTFEPFGVVLHRLKAEAGLSFRQLAELVRELDPAERGLSGGYLVQLANGVEDPPPSAIGLIAAAFGLEPSYFVEYRLALLREAFDERVSFEDAVRNLVAVEPALDDLRVGVGATYRGYVRARRRKARTSA
jgi:transcriptional regulator with XRE-family HTH domain